jgi:hypothetical protein
LFVEVLDCIPTEVQLLGNIALMGTISGFATPKSPSALSV